MIRECINSFDTNPVLYLNGKQSQIKVVKGIGNEVFHKSLHPDAKIEINFGMSVGCKVFIGEGFKGSVKVQFSKPDCIFYIGNHVEIDNLLVKLRAARSGVYIGSNVTTSGPCLMVARSDNDAASKIIIGDHCLLSYDIAIRNDDQHPVFDATTWQRVNLPSSNVVVEPYCWIGHRATILKNVRVGACSIIGSGAVVTKPIPRFSSAMGSPAIVKSIQGKIWSRGSGASMLDAQMYLDRYAEPGSFTRLKKLPGLSESDEPSDD